MTEDINLASGGEGSDSVVQPWQPEKHCKNVDSYEIRMSRGFLRSMPERWFPGLYAHWLPLFHATSTEFKILEVTPLLSDNINQISLAVNPSGKGEVEATGAWLIDDEPVVIYLDRNSKNHIAHAFSPNSSRYARKVLLEYLSRRLAFSLKASWSGMESAQLSYESEFQFDHFRTNTWIRLVALVNNEKICILFGISKILAEKLDGLWRRQVKPSPGGSLLTRLQKQATNLIRIEIARLSVPPQSLPSYLKSGNLIDLEIPISNKVNLRVANDSWLAAELCYTNNKFALQTLYSLPTSQQVIEGATPLSVEIGSFKLDSDTCAELEQPGALLETEFSLSDIIHLTIRGDKVGKARLVKYEGRFAIAVI